jgi:probable HAF family extracellular repeat protein
MFTSTGATRGFRLARRGELQDLGSLGGSDADTVEAYALNMWGTIVGTTQVIGGAGRAFIWSERQGMRNLNDLIDPSVTNKPLLGVGKAINDLGAIVAEGVSETTGRVFLLTPRFQRHGRPCE